MENINKSIRVKLFGSLRDYGDSSQAEITVSAARNVSELKEVLVRFFNESHPSFDAASILSESAFADDRNILSSEASLEGKDWVAVLPPVCGG